MKASTNGLPRYSLMDTVVPARVLPENARAGLPVVPEPQPASSVATRISAAPRATAIPRTGIPRRARCGFAPRALPLWLARAGRCGSRPGRGLCGFGRT
jgi:hypothetical protein